MSRTIPLGRVRGVPIRVGPSWLFVMPLVCLSLYAGGADQSPVSRIVIAVAGTAAMFASVLAHEVGHALYALRSDIRVDRIVLFLFGGYTEMQVDDAAPAHDLAVAAAGPIVSALLAAVCWAISFALGAGDAARVLRLLAVVNGGVALFNLLPGFPLDGGRIARSILVLGGVAVRRAEALTAWFGLAIGVVLVVVGYAGATMGRSGAILAIPVGVMVGVLAWAGRPAERRTAADLMRPAPAAVPESAPIASLDTKTGAVPVVSSGRVVGLVVGRAVGGVVGEGMDAVLPGDVVGEATPVSQVVAAIRRTGRTLVVVDSAGVIAGLIGPEDVPADLIAVAEET